MDNLTAIHDVARAIVQLYKAEDNEYGLESRIRIALYKAIQEESLECYAKVLNQSIELMKSV